MHRIFRALWLPCLVACAIASLNVAVIVHADRTTLCTSNGLWKAPNISAWENSTGRPLDSGGFAYAPLIGFLSRGIPDGWMQYAAPVPDPAFRKMAVIDGLLGGIAAGIVCALALALTGSAALSVAIAMLHASAAFILANSWNNEDIFPGYTFFLAASALLFAWVRDRRAGWLAGSCACLAMMTLLHWTLLPPAVAAFGAVLVILGWRDRKVWLLTPAFALLFVILLHVLLLPAGIRFPTMDILLPNKATGSGWVGLIPDKWIYVVVGMGNYFAGGVNTSDSARVFRGEAGVNVAISLVVAGIAILLCCAAALRPKVRPEVRLLAVFGLVLLCVGQAENVYGQAQDPQMQIQPMFVVIVGAIVLGWELSQRLSRTHAAIAAAVLAIAACWNGVRNGRDLLGRLKPDSESIRLVQEMRERFPPGKALVVTLGFDGWLSWDFLLNYSGKSEEFIASGLHLARPLTVGADHSAEQCARFVWNIVDGALCSGEKVYANALWTQPRDAFVRSVTIVTSAENGGRYYDLMRAGAQPGEAFLVQGKPFVELKRAPECPAVRQPWRQQ